MCIHELGLGDKGNWESTYNHEQNFGRLTFLGHVTIQKYPTPPLNPKITLDKCIQNFSLSFSFIQGGGRENCKKSFTKDALFYEGTQKLQKLMNTEIAVLRTFVQIYRLKNLNLILTCNTNTGRYWHKFCCKNTSTLYCASYLPFWSVLETVLFVFSTINQTQAVYIDWTAPQCDSCIRNCH